MSVLTHMRPLRSVRVRSITAVLAAVGAGALLAGCASSATPGASSSAPVSSTSEAPAAPDSSAPDTSAPETSAPGSSAGGSELVDLVWVSTEVTGQELVPDSDIVLTVQDGRLSVNAGCNGMNGTLVDNGGTWEVGPLASTMMACADDLMAQDAWVGEFLESGPTATTSPGTLTLTSGDVSITFTERAAPILGDVVWTLTGLITKDAVTSLPIPAEGATLRITDGRLELAGICNGTGGEVTIEGDTLTVELGPSTLMSCGEEVDAAEQHARAVLGGTSTYIIDDQQLRILKDDGIGLQFTAAGPNLPDDMETMPSVTDLVETFPESPQTSNG